MKSRALLKRTAAVGSFDKLEIALDGPFALVMMQGSPSLRIFTAIEHNDLHAFFINGSSAQETKKTHSLTLVTEQGAIQDGNTALPDTRDSLFTDFNWHSPEKDIDSTDNLVEMALPLPDRIFADDETITPVRFEDPHLGVTPQGHILEYTVTDPTKSIKMTDSLTGDIVPQTSPNPKARRITLQIGMIVVSGREPDEHGVHAKHFHNDVLLARFVKIKDDKDKRLDSVGEFFARGPFATTVECKSGGFIVTIP